MGKRRNCGKGKDTWRNVKTVERKGIGPSSVLCVFVVCSFSVIVSFQCLLVHVVWKLAMTLTTVFIHVVNVLFKIVVLSYIESFISELLLINISRNILLTFRFKFFYLFRKVNLLEREKQKMMIKQIKSIRSMWSVMKRKKMTIEVQNVKTFYIFYCTVCFINMV